MLEELQEDGEAEARRAGLVGKQRLLAGEQGPMFGHSSGSSRVSCGPPFWQQANPRLSARRKSGCPKPGGSIAFRELRKGEMSAAGRG